MSRTHPPITDVSCECHQPQQTDDDRGCGRLWRKLKKGLIAGNHVVTKNYSPNDKSYSLTDWHLKSACWRRPDKSENAKDEIQRPISGGAQHAWCNRGKFFSRIAKMIFNGQGRRGKAFEVEQEKEKTADHLPQDHRQQDLLHHQPADEGNRAWVFIQDGNLWNSHLRWTTRWTGWWWWPSMAAWCWRATATSSRCNNLWEKISVQNVLKITKYSNLSIVTSSRWWTMSLLGMRTGSIGLLALTRSKTEPATGSSGWRPWETM